MVRLAADRLQRRSDDDLLTFVGDATTFANGVVILLAAANQEVVLKALGDTTPYLVFAGLASVLAPLRALKQPRRRS